MVKINLIKSRIDQLTPQQREYLGKIAIDAYRIGITEGKTRAFYDVAALLARKEREFLERRHAERRLQDGGIQEKK
jgi:hypothetical protein